MGTNCILSFCLSGHGFSGVVCVNGEIVVATSLERLTRVKNDILLPISRGDLETFGWKSDPAIYRRDVDLPFDLDRDDSQVDLAAVEKFQRLLAYLLDAANVTLADVTAVAWSYRQNEAARRFFASHAPKAAFVVPEHHYGHACQAFLSSPFTEAAIMIVDGQGVPLERTGGDQLSGCLAYGQGTAIDTLWDVPVRYSLGGMYGAFTKAVGFETNEEGKTMGLAPYGNSEYYDALKTELQFETREFGIRNWRQLIARGFRPEDVLYQLPHYQAFLNKFPRRAKNEPLTDVHRNLAFAVQELTEDVMVFLADWLHEKTGSANLCIAGGVGLNCVANYQVLRRSKFTNIFIHPNAGDNGLAVGQALHVYNQIQGNPRVYVATTDSLGRAYSEADVNAVVDVHRTREDIAVRTFDDLEEMYDVMAAAIADGQITSWFQGRSEFGPRALGNRSIIADPRRADMKDILNSRVKFRESFRPFTPSVLAERASEYFELDVDSPFMLLAAYVRPGKGEIVPAITHVDNTARVQTVDAATNPGFYDILKAFDELTGCAVLINTSFNVRGEPIVCTPKDAYRCFMRSGLDALVIDDFLFRKADQPASADDDTWRSEYELD